MTDIVERLRATDGTLDITTILDRCNEAADEIERLRAIEALYKAAKDQWNPVYKMVLDDRDRLRAVLEKIAGGFVNEAMPDEDLAVALQDIARSALNRGEK